MKKMENAEQAVFTARIVKREAAEPPPLRYPVIFYGDGIEVKTAERQQVPVRPFLLEKVPNSYFAQPHYFEPVEHVDDLPAWYKHIERDYYEGDDGYYVLLNNGEYVRITDFKITLLRRTKILKNTDGEEIEKITTKVRNDLGREILLEVRIEEWVNLQSIIEHKAPFMQFIGEKVGNIKERFKGLLAILLKQSFENLPSSIVVETWGWGPKLADGRRHFYHGGREDCCSPKCLSAHIDAERLQQGLGILEVAPQEVIRPLLLYSLAAYTDQLFTDAGYPLASCLMLVGESGMMKSALSRVVFSPFVPESKRLFSVRSTEASMNVMTEQCLDDVLVIDDFNLEGTRAEVLQKMKLMRGLIRGYSDKTPRTKYGGNDNIKQYKIRGGCVFTGETRLTGQLKSSELRYLLIEMRTRVDGEKLRQYQEKPDLMQVLISAYVYFLEENYRSVVLEIARQFPSLREAFADIKEPRMRDTCIHLVLTSKLAFVAFQNVLHLDNSFAENWSTVNEKILFDICYRQSNEVQDDEPYIRYLAEFFNLIGTGDIKIASNIEQYVNSLDYFDGYMDEQLCMLKKDVIYGKIQQAFYGKQSSLPIDVDEVSRKLKEASLTKCDANSALKKASSKIPGRPRMLALFYKQAFDMVERKEVL